MTVEPVNPTEALAPLQEVRRPVDPEDLFALRFVMGADLSADGRSVVYALSRTDLDANTDVTDLFLLDVVSGERRRLTDMDTVHAGPTVSPDGSQVAYLSVRGCGCQASSARPQDCVTTFPRALTG